MNCILHLETLCSLRARARSKCWMLPAIAEQRKSSTYWIQIILGLRYFARMDGSSQRRLAWVMNGWDLATQKENWVQCGAEPDHSLCRPPHDHKRMMLWERSDPDGCAARQSPAVRNLPKALCRLGRDPLMRAMQGLRIQQWLIILHNSVGASLDVCMYVECKEAKFKINQKTKDQKMG